MTIALVMSWRPHWPLCVPCLGRTAVSSCQAGPGLRLHPHCMMTAASASIDLTADSCLAVTAGHSLPLSAPPQTGSCLCPLSESPRGTWSARPSPPPPYLGQEAPPLIAASCHTFDFSPSYSYNQRGATLVCCVAALISLVYWLRSIIIHLAELWHLHTPIVSIMQRLDTDMTSPHQGYLFAETGVLRTLTALHQYTPPLGLTFTRLRRDRQQTLYIVRPRIKLRGGIMKT